MFELLLHGMPTLPSTAPVAASSRTNTDGCLHLLVDGPDIVPVRVPLASPAPAEPLLVRVARRRAVHITAGAQALDRLSLTALADDGRVLLFVDPYEAFHALSFGANCDGPRGLSRDARAVILSHHGVALGRLALTGDAADVERCFTASPGAAR